MVATFQGRFLEEKEVLFLDPDTNEPFHVPLNKDNPVVNVSHIGTYPPKQVMGDWTRADHEVLSSYVQADFVGGGQVRYADEATDQSRFWFGNLSTLHPYQTALPLETGAHLGDGVAIPLGDFNGSFYAAFGTRLVRATHTTITDIDDLAEVPMSKPGVAFTGTHGTSRFFIPMGSHGYQIFDGATLSPLITDVLPIQFLEWDNKLYALQATGELFESLDGESDWVEKLAIPPEAEARGLIEFYDRQDNPTIHIYSRRAVYGCDLSLGKAYRTELDPPPHHDAALGASKWRTDLYVSYGVGVHQYTGNSIIAMGLDRNAGLPKELKGAITSLAEGYNGLYALVRGTSVLEEDAATQTLITDGGWHDIYLPPTRSQSAVMMWDSFGWSTVWLSEDTNNAPSSLLISTASGAERLWWGYGKTLHFQDIHHMYYNPEQRPEGVRYAKEGWMELSTMDFAMAGQTKILYALEVMTKNLTTTETVQLEYRIDDGDWIPLPVLRTQPLGKKTVFYMGENGTFPDGLTPRFDGVPFNDLTLRVNLARGDDPSKTPILESVAVVYHKLMGSLLAYQLQTPLGSDEFKVWKNHTAPEVINFLHRMVSGKKLVPMLYAGKWRSVRFAGVSGDNTDGMDFSGNRLVSVLEVLD